MKLPFTIVPRISTVVQTFHFIICSPLHTFHFSQWKVSTRRTSRNLISTMKIMGGWCFLHDILVNIIASARVELYPQRAWIASMWNVRFNTTINNYIFYSRLIDSVNISYPTSNSSKEIELHSIEQQVKLFPTNIYDVVLFVSYPGRINIWNWKYLPKIHRELLWSMIHAYTIYTNFIYTI